MHIAIMEIVKPIIVFNTNEKLVIAMNAPV